LGLVGLLVACYGGYCKIFLTSFSVPIIFDDFLKEIDNLSFVENNGCFEFKFNFECWPIDGVKIAKKIFEFETTVKVENF
jgi:hypothetical protein